jgi:hypothetical protein
MARPPNSSCQVSQQALAEGLAETPASYSVLGADDTPDLAFSPFEQFDIYLTRPCVFEDRRLPLPICSGTSLFVSKPKFFTPHGMKSIWATLEF